MPFEHLDVDFSSEDRDLVQEALGLLVSRLRTSCTLRKFLGAIVGEIQELYDAIQDMKRLRTIYDAVAAQLDAIGRIVGQDRAPFTYSDTYYFKWDNPSQGWDLSPWYTYNAPLGAFIAESDPRYRESIIYRIIKNHTIVASIPEITTLLRTMLQMEVSFIKRGPMHVDIVISQAISAENLSRLTKANTTPFVDDSYAVAYPATLDFSGITTFLPGIWFCFDRADGQQWDAGQWATTTGSLIG